MAVAVSGGGSGGTIDLTGRRSIWISSSSSLDTLSREGGLVREVLGPHLIVEQLWREEIRDSRAPSVFMRSRLAQFRNADNEMENDGQAHVALPLQWMRRCRYSHERAPCHHGRGLFVGFQKRTPPDIRRSGVQRGRRTEGAVYWMTSRSVKRCSPACRFTR